MKYQIIRERTDIITYKFVDYVECDDPEELDYEIDELDESESVIMSEQVITGDTITLSTEPVTSER